MISALSPELFLIRFSIQQRQTKPNPRSAAHSLIHGWPEISRAANEVVLGCETLSQKLALFWSSGWSWGSGTSVIMSLLFFIYKSNDDGLRWAFIKSQNHSVLHSQWVMKDQVTANTKVYAGDNCCGSGTWVGGKIEKIIWDQTSAKKEFTGCLIGTEMRADGGTGESCYQVKMLISDREQECVCVFKTGKHWSRRIFGLTLTSLPLCARTQISAHSQG